MNDFDIPVVRPGEVFKPSANRDNKIREALRRQITGKNVIQTPTGWHVRPQTQEPHRVILRNASGATAPAFSFARVTDVLEDGLVHEINKPDADDMENIVLTDDEAIPDTKDGYGWDYGTHPVLYTGAAPAVGDRVGSDSAAWTGLKSDAGPFICRDVIAADTKAFIWLGGGGSPAPVAPGDVDTLGVNTEGTEAAYADTWDVTADRTKGLDVYIMLRNGYFDAGNEIWYGYIRKFTFDERGRLTTVSAETRIVVDTPGVCP